MHQQIAPADGALIGHDPLMSHPAIAGFVAPDFQRVREQFERNFTERGELGAAFAVIRDGELVVDLWGGLADRTAGRAWERDTLQVVFSGTKGFVAVCLLLLLDRGLLELDASVSRYWPAFGKDEVRVRDLAGHTARLPGVDAPLSLDEAMAGHRPVELLEEQEPSDEPRAGLCYHALTFGWLCDELVRRIDGRSIGTFFAEEVARPLELDAWIGLPPELEARVSTLKLAADWPQSPHLRQESFEADPLVRSIWGNPPFFSRESFPCNSPSFHQAEVPAVSGIGTARSIARLYGGLGDLVGPETLELARTTLSEGSDETHGGPVRFGVGFQLQTDLMRFGPVPEAFGHDGAGGSVHGAWPEERIGFSYAMNLMRDSDDNARSLALLEALHYSL